jgi:hypothetical protein
VAGLRVHGTTRRVPRVVFEDEERAHLQPYDGIPYDVPLWKEVTVHPDHHVSVQYALYSAPSTTCPPGTQLEARCDTKLVKLYRAGELVKVHSRKPKGGRSTDYDDYFVDPIAFLRAGGVEWHDRSRDPDLLTGVLLQQVATFFGLELYRAVKLTVHSYLRQLPDEDRGRLRWGTMLTQRTRLCDRCVVERPYGRVYWRLRW